MKGKLAFSKAGHDKGKLYLVIREEGNRVWLSDGKTRGVLAPKGKNRKHIQPAGRGFSEEEVDSFQENPAWADNRIREAIDRFCCDGSRREKEAEKEKRQSK